MMSEVGGGESQYNGSQDMTQLNDPDGLLQNSSLSKKTYDDESDPKY